MQDNRVNFAGLDKDFIKNRLQKNLKEISPENIKIIQQNIEYNQKQEIPNNIIKENLPPTILPLVKLGYKKKEIIKKIPILNSFAVSLKEYLGKKTMEAEKQKQGIMVGELLNYHSVDFVTKLYTEILGRKPDVDGLKNYLLMLNQGVSKEALIYIFYKSEEARSKKISIQGIEKLRTPYRIYKAKNIIKKLPIIWIYRIFLGPKRLHELHSDYTNHKINTQFETEKILEKVEYQKNAHNEAFYQYMQKSEQLSSSLEQDATKIHQQFQNMYKQINKVDISSRRKFRTIDKANQQIIRKIDAKIIKDIALLENKCTEVSDELQNVKKMIKSIKYNQKHDKIEISKTLYSSRELIKKNKELIEQNCAKQDLIIKQTEAYQSLIDDKLTFLTENFLSIQEELKLIKNNKNNVISAGNNLSIIKIDDFILALPSEEWRMVAYLHHKGYMEPGTIKVFKDIIKPGMRVVDVGANVGIFTLIAIRNVGLKGRVFSFEPTPRIYEILKDNIQINGFLETGIVDFYNFAVTDQEGKGALAIYNNNNGHNTIFPKEAEDFTLEIDTVSLDQFLGNKIDKIDVIKIDVEGAEPLVLKGMKRLIEENMDIKIIMEFAPIHLKRSGIDSINFINELLEMGLCIRAINEATGELLEISPAELENIYSVNLLLQRGQAEK